VDTGISPEDMKAESPAVQSQAKARQAFHSAFFDECSRGLSPNSAALEALQHYRWTAKQAAAPVLGQAEARRQFHEAFLQECERGLSPNSAAVEVIHRCGATVHARAAPGVAAREPATARPAAASPEDRRLSESKELLVRETGRSSPLPA